MKVLVTGAAGFIGSTLTEHLLDDGAEVTALDSFDDFYSPAIKRGNLDAARGRDGFRLVEGDIRDAAFLDETFRGGGFDAVVHLAARAGVRPSLKQAPLYVDVNVVGTSRLLEACRAHGVRRFLFTSTSSVYGSRPAEPFRESDVADAPMSPYAATKRAAEILCSTYHRLYGLSITCLRLFTVYGPRQRPEMAIHRFTELIYTGEPVPVFGDGSARRDFTYVDDIVQGFQRALDCCSGWRIYNLGGGATVELREVIAHIERAVGKKAKLRHLPDEPGDVPNTFADISLARNEIGYRPQVPVAEGIPRFVAWYRARQEHGAGSRA